MTISKNTSSLILGITSFVFTRILFLLFNNPEGPNLLIVTGMALIIYGISLTVYSFAISLKTLSPLSNTPQIKLLLVMVIQIFLLGGLFFY